MEYRSTRDSRNTVQAALAILQGIAPDGGLYVPSAESLHAFDPESVLLKPYSEAAEQILRFFFPELPDLSGAVRAAYGSGFETEEPVRLVKAGERYILELFHGPTKAFKDLALQMLPELVLRAKAVEQREEETLILTATSGDTGKAAMEGFRDVPGTRILVFFPSEGVSKVQEAQMRTQEGSNTAAIGVEGNFDDVQTAVKEIFADLQKKEIVPGKKIRLSSANSINIGRLVPQIVYYFHAYSELLKKGVIQKGEEVDFTVPTGNFGDILAGFYAKEMGLPVHRLICASNKNRILSDFITTGIYDKNRSFYKTASPSMDILVSSNLERLLYFVSEEDSAYVRQRMEELKEDGVFRVDAEILAKIQAVFSCGSMDDGAAAEEIRRTYEQDGYLADTHTAVALGVCREYSRDEKPTCPGIVLSTASPYKFPEAVLLALRGGEETKDTEGLTDGFAAMEALETISKVPAPEALRTLPGKAVRFKGNIRREEMEETVLRFAKGESL